MALTWHSHGPSNGHQLIKDHLKEMYPIIYTPTEGIAIQNFSRIFRRPEGCFLNINDQGRVYRDLAQWGEPNDIDYIVVTDGEEILGIGDQGVGGILISVAKLVLTTLCAGIHANRTLAVALDCGTDNQELLDDELYLGLKQPRIRGEKYDEFIDTFVQSARKLYPKAYIHFEDFGLPNGNYSPFPSFLWWHAWTESERKYHWENRKSCGVGRHRLTTCSEENTGQIPPGNSLLQRRRPRHWLRHPRRHHGRPAHHQTEVDGREDSDFRRGHSRNRNRRSSTRCDCYREWKIKGGRCKANMVEPSRSLNIDGVG